jgi:hypothetical protein
MTGLDPMSRGDIPSFVTGKGTRPTDGWPAFDAALTKAHVPHEGHIYQGANHGFHNDATPRYDEAVAKEAWQNTLDWLNKYLRWIGAITSKRHRNLKARADDLGSLATAADQVLRRHAMKALAQN